MAIRINTNIDSVFAQKHLARTQRAQRSSMARLSSGLRITKAADDAAGHDDNRGPQPNGNGAEVTHTSQRLPLTARVEPN